MIVVLNLSRHSHQLSVDIFSAKIILMLLSLILKDEPMILKTNILTVDKNKQAYYLPDHYIRICDGLISEISNNCLENYIDYTDFIICPGYIDTHVHIAQYNIRGRYRPHLLDWLNEFTFNEEKKFIDPDYADQVSRQFFSETISKGTTTISAYMTIHPDACDIAFKNAEKAGIRAFIGKVMMDQNSPDFLTENPQKSILDSIDLYEKWNNKSSLLNYIFTPRFAPTCSWELMKELGSFITKHEAYLQTHLSENLNEIAWVNQIYPHCETYTDVYYETGLMTPKSIFGHSIHLSEKEISLFKETTAKIAHCPDSNFFLKSGAFPMEQLIQENIDFALASDVAAGTTLSMPYHMKMAIYRQDHFTLSPVEAFYYATLGGAKVLSIDSITGSIEYGKSADLIFYKKEDIMQGRAEDMIADLVFTGQDKNIHKVMIHGNFVKQ